jgi:hypothetical protein
MRVIHCGACDKGQMTISYVNGCLCPCHAGSHRKRLSWQERAELLRRLHERVG